MCPILAKSLAAGGACFTTLNFEVRGPDIGDELRRSLLEVDARVGLSSILRQALFVADDGVRVQAEAILGDVFGGTAPATTYVYQPPADGAALAAELWALGGTGSVEQRGHMSVATWNGARLGFLGALQTPGGGGLHEQVTRMLTQALEGLAGAGFSLGDLVRTWYYIGQVLGECEEGQRYGTFNRARNGFYSRTWPDLCDVPASTGIGMNTDRVMMECLAANSGGGPLEVTWIDNPLQTMPVHYDIAVEPECKPAFSRAAALRLPGAVIILVSGTASVRRSEVLCPDDPAGQTETTIENIAALIAQENLKGNYGLPRGARLDDLLQYRVYVKRASDLQSVRQVCSARLPHVPCAYMVADVCRPDWLVEIEGIAAFPCEDGC